MYCTPEGTGTLEYIWYHNDVKLQYDGPNLVIEQMKLTDAGSYKCCVHSKFGDDSSTVKVNVGEYNANSVNTNLLHIYLVTCIPINIPF